MSSQTRHTAEQQMPAAKQAQNTDECGQVARQMPSLDSHVKITYWNDALIMETEALMTRFDSLKY